MQTVAETRRQRLAMLVKRHGDSLAKLNQVLGLDRTDATLSQIRTQAPHSKTGKPRSMGDDLARRIEEKLALAAGWMDTPPPYAELEGGTDQLSKALQLMEALPADQWDTALRLLDALAKPARKDGTKD
jgi:hypothetical protein